MKPRFPRTPIGPFVAPVDPDVFLRVWLRVTTASNGSDQNPLSRLAETLFREAPSAHLVPITMRVMALVRMVAGGKLDHLLSPDKTSIQTDAIRAAAATTLSQDGFFDLRHHQMLMRKNCAA